jgi:hypothetical protein
MEYPDWYPDWRHDAVHQLQEKNARLEREFRLGAWPRFDYDVDNGTLIFSEQGVAKVIAEIQIVGTTSFKVGNWLWAWANSHWPLERVVDAERVRAFGEEHGIGELAHDYIEDEDLNGLGWELTAVAARIADAAGAYRPLHSDGGGLYFTLKNIGWAG